MAVTGISVGLVQNRTVICSGLVAAMLVAWCWRAWPSFVMPSDLAAYHGISHQSVEIVGIGPGAVDLAVGRELARLPKVSGSVDTSKVYVTQAVNEALTKAESEAAKLKDEFVSVEHLLLGLIDVAKPEGFRRFLRSFDLDRASGRIFSYDVTGGRYEEHDFYAVGSGSVFARGSLKKLYRRDMDAAAAVDGIRSRRLRGGRRCHPAAAWRVFLTLDARARRVLSKCGIRRRLGCVHRGHPRSAACRSQRRGSQEATSLARSLAG